MARRKFEGIEDYKIQDYQCTQAKYKYSTAMEETVESFHKMDHDHNLSSQLKPWKRDVALFAPNQAPT